MCVHVWCYTLCSYVSYMYTYRSTQPSTSSTHAQSIPSHQQHHQSPTTEPGKRCIHTAAVEYATSKGIHATGFNFFFIQFFLLTHITSADRCGTTGSQSTIAIMSDTEKSVRDRLGLWGIGGSDAEVPGNVSGIQRIKQSRYNKVSKGRMPHFDTDIVSGNIFKLFHWILYNWQAMYCRHLQILKVVHRYSCEQYNSYNLYSIDFPSYIIVLLSNIPWTCLYNMLVFGEIPGVGISPTKRKLSL